MYGLNLCYNKYESMMMIMMIAVNIKTIQIIITIIMTINILLSIEIFNNNKNV